MADKKEPASKDKADEKVEPPKKKTMLYVGGGAAALLAVAFVASLMAVPKKAHEPELEGPFVAKLSKTDIQANLAGADGKRYVVMSLQAEYYAYDESYVQGRLGGGASGGGHGGASAEDPLYMATLKDALLNLAATKTINQITDPTFSEPFLEEIREAVDPVLFPVFLGESHSPYLPDEKSGLRMGESAMESTMRGLLHEHFIEIDAQDKTLQLDDGPALPIRKDRDLKLANRKGETVYVDTTRLEPAFSGKVPVGVPGRVRRIFKDSFLIQ